MLRFAHTSIFMAFVFVAILIVLYIFVNKTLDVKLKKTFGTKISSNMSFFSLCS